MATSATAQDKLRVDGARNYSYLPTRPAVARYILRRLPVQEHSTYTFVDFGSGKGRVLLLAAELPFYQVRGIEFDHELHLQAQTNISRWKGRRACSDVRSLNIDALEYEFPPTNLAIYFFNPFAPEVMAALFTRLRTSLQENPRRVVLALLYPEYDAITAVVPELKLVTRQGSILLFSN